MTKEVDSGASPQCGLRGGRSHCNTVQIKKKSEASEGWEKTFSTHVLELFSQNLCKSSIFIILFRLNDKMCFINGREEVPSHRDDIFDLPLYGILRILPMLCRPISC